MTLIDEIYKDDNRIRFYDGIDFDMVRNHSSEGLDGMVYFFIDSWKTELIRSKRDNKINEIIGDGLNIDIEDIDNNYMVIYQTEGHTMEVYKTIRNKIDQVSSSQNWIPIIKS